MQFKFLSALGLGLLALLLSIFAGGVWTVLLVANLRSTPGWNQSPGYDLVCIFEKMFPGHQTNRNEFTTRMNAWLTEGISADQIRSMMKVFAQEQRRETDPTYISRTPWRHFVKSRGHLMNETKKSDYSDPQRDEYISQPERVERALTRIRSGEL